MRSFFFLYLLGSSSYIKLKHNIYVKGLAILKCTPNEILVFGCLFSSLV